MHWRIKMADRRDYNIEDTARLMTRAGGGDSDKSGIVAIIGSAAGILLIGIGIFLIVI